MTKLILNLKREYWEYRRVVLGIPIVLSVLVVLASAMVTMYHAHGDKKTSDQVGVEQSQTLANVDEELTPLALNEETEEKGGDDDAANAAPSLTSEQLREQTPFRFMAVYIAVAWLAALFYLLSSLYSDRKDKSILYWKSLPVSETQHVLSKFLFGAVGFAVISIAIAWAVYSLLYVLGFGAVSSPDAGDTWQFVERVFNATRLFVWPLIAVAVGVIWGAPFFSFALLISAISKRMPFLTMLLPLVVIAALERIIFSSSHLIDFFTSHFPFAVLEQLSDDQSITGLLNAFFVERGKSLFFGLVLSAIFIAEAIWYRNKRFEI